MCSICFRKKKIYYKTSLLDFAPFSSVCITKVASLFRLDTCIILVAPYYPLQCKESVVYNSFKATL